MKKIYTFATVVFMIINSSVYAQVGIGTATPDASSALQISTPDRGLLIPTVILTATNVAAPIPLPATSLLVYNSNTTAGATGVSPGYYYWNGGWIKLAAALPVAGWALTGNTGTTAGTNFLGTTDAVDLRIKTGNADRFDFTSNGRLRSYDNGTQALPTYSWNGDTGTGFWRPAASTLAFSTGATEKVRITPTGQLGIGTTAPNASAILDISSTNKGVSFPNVNLLSETDAATIASPVTGLMVYNINTGMPCGKGLYFNNGTNVSPVWSCFKKTVQNYHAYNSAARLGVTSTTHTLQPGCTINFTVPTGQIVDVKIDGVLGGLNTSTASGRYSVFDAIVYVDGAPLPQGGWNRVSIGNNTTTNNFNVCTFSTLWSGVTGGSHTVQLYSARLVGTTSVDLGGDCTLDTNCGEINAIVNYR